MKESDTKKELSNDDRVIFIPLEEIRIFEGIFNKMKQAQQEFHKVVKKINMGN